MLLKRVVYNTRTGAPNQLWRLIHTKNRLYEAQSSQKITIKNFQNVDQKIVILHKRYQNGAFIEQRDLFKALKFRFSNFPSNEDLDPNRDIYDDMDELDDTQDPIEDPGPQEIPKMVFFETENDEFDPQPTLKKSTPKYEQMNINLLNKNLARAMKEAKSDKQLISIFMQNKAHFSLINYSSLLNKFSRPIERFENLDHFIKLEILNSLYSALKSEKEDLPNSVIAMIFHSIANLYPVAKKLEVYPKLVSFLTTEGTKLIASMPERNFGAFLYAQIKLKNWEYLESQRKRIAKKAIRFTERGLSSIIYCFSEPKNFRSEETQELFGVLLATRLSANFKVEHPKSYTMLLGFACKAKLRPELRQKLLEKLLPLMEPMIKGCPWDEKLVGSICYSLSCLDPPPDPKYLTFLEKSVLDVFDKSRQQMKLVGACLKLFSVELNGRVFGSVEVFEKLYSPFLRKTDFITLYDLSLYLYQFPLKTLPGIRAKQYLNAMDSILAKDHPDVFYSCDLNTYTKVLVGMHNVRRAHHFSQKAYKSVFKRLFEYLKTNQTKETTYSLRSLVNLTITANLLNCYYIEGGVKGFPALNIENLNLILLTLFMKKRYFKDELLNLSKYVSLVDIFNNLLIRGHPKKEALGVILTHWVCQSLRIEGFEGDGVGEVASVEDLKFVLFIFENLVFYDLGGGELDRREMATNQLVLEVWELYESMCDQFFVEMREKFGSDEKQNLGNFGGFEDSGGVVDAVEEVSEEVDVDEAKIDDFLSKLEFPHLRLDQKELSWKDHIGDLEREFERLKERFGRK